MGAQMIRMPRIRLMIPLASTQPAPGSPALLNAPYEETCVIPPNKAKNPMIKENVDSIFSLPIGLAKRFHKDQDADNVKIIPFASVQPIPL